MKLKSDFDQIVLTKTERATFSDIKKHPHASKTDSEIGKLWSFGIVSRDWEGRNELGEPLYKDTWRISEDGKRFISYERQRTRLLLLKSVWLPIAVSFLTAIFTLTLWPLISNLLSEM